MKSSPLRIVAFAFAALAFLSGCRTIPDLQPFTAATAQLSASVRAAGKSTVGDLNTLATAYTTEADALEESGDPTAAAVRRSARSIEASAQALEKNWAASIAMMKAVADYSQSLEAIATAGKQGRASAEAAGNSLKSLLDAVDTALPGGEAVVKLAAKAYGHVAEARAADSLARALAEGQPAVEEVAAVIAANFASLRTINRRLYLELVSIEDDASRAGFDVGRERATLQIARAAHDALRLELQQALKLTDSGARDEALQTISERNQRIEAIIAFSTTKLTPVDAAREKTRARGQQQAELLTAAIAAVDEWAAYHGRLLRALEQKQAPSAEALAAAAADVRELLQLLRTKS